MPIEKQKVDSVWTRPRRTREQPTLTRERIVEVAITLLDTEGMEALSMRQLGAKLNAGATSLYRHVANRDELIELVVDEVYGEIEVPEIKAASQWRAASEQCSESLRAMILRHPWMAATLGQVGLSYLGPNVMRWTDRMAAVFQTGGFPESEIGEAIGALTSFVVGQSISEAAWLTVLARSGQTEQEFTETLRPAVEQATAEYSHLQQTPLNEDPLTIRNRKFHYGLARILEGLDPRRTP